MTNAEFERILRQDLSFNHTPSSTRGWRNYPWLASACFYLYLFKVHWFASRHARDLRYPYFPDGFKSASGDILRQALAIGAHLQIAGLEHLARTPESVVIVGNHMSSLETMILPAIILPFKDMSFVIKDDLLRYPLIGHTLRRVESIAVSRSSPKEDLRAVLSLGVDQIQRGRSIVIFPQSTRSVAFNPDEFNSLGVKLARKAGVPVVPLALKTDIWQNGKIFKDLGKIDVTKPVHVEFGPPLPVTGNGSETHDRVIAFITSRLTTWTR